jgi:hypothetical protein
MRAASSTPECSTKFQKGQWDWPAVKADISIVDRDLNANQPLPPRR